VVPSVVHFIHLNGGQLPLYIFLHFLAAQHRLKPDIIYFHYVDEPTGRLWHKIFDAYEIKQANGESKTMIVTPVQHEQPISIHGITPKEWAHKSDIVRLEAIRKYGGIYVDTDVLVLRNFDPFRRVPFTMGDWRAPPLDLILCNAVVISTKDSDFLHKWYESYKNADFSCWDCQSTVYPTELARNDTNKPFIHVASRHAFFTINWLNPGTDALFSEHRGREIPEPYEGIFAQHMWHARHKRQLGGLAPHYVCTSKSFYGYMLRYALDGTPWLHTHCHNHNTHNNNNNNNSTMS
jgi:hypothetical protein